MNSIKLIVILFIMTIYSSANAQEYKSYTYLGLQRNFGTLTNPYTNGKTDNFKEKFGITLLEFGAEGMDKSFFVSFKTHFFGVIPDYIFKAVNKKNRAVIYGDEMETFHTEYNKAPQQYEFNASFADWDVLGCSISYGYKYFFIGGNFAWANTSLKSYQSVSNIKIKNQKPPDFHSFNTLGNFTYGLNIVLGNNKPEQPLRIICAYDWLLIRDYSKKWRNDFGSRLSFDLQGKIPVKFKNSKWGLYAGAAYRMHNIDYLILDNAIELEQNFKSAISSFRLGLIW